MTRKEFLAQYKTKEWYELSKKIKARDHNTCQMCGRNDVPLSVHHLKYGEDGSLFVNDDCDDYDDEYERFDDWLFARNFYS